MAACPAFHCILGIASASMHSGRLSAPLCVLQATHIFDGLESWPTHLMYLAAGRLQLFSPTSHMPQLHEVGLLRLVEG